MKDLFSLSRENEELADSWLDFETELDNLDDIELDDILETELDYLVKFKD